MSLIAPFRFQSVLPLALVVSPLLTGQLSALAQSDSLPILEPNIDPTVELPLPQPRIEPRVEPAPESIPAVPAAPVTPPVTPPATPPVSQPVAPPSVSQPPVQIVAPPAVQTPEVLPTAPPQTEPSRSDRAPSVDPYNFTPTTIQPIPFDGKTISTLSALADGSYRYLAGDAEPRVYSNAELNQRGGSIFLLSKVGNRVTGYLLPGIGRAGLCITGIASGDSITGTAYANAPSQSIETAASPYDSILQLQNIRTDSSGLELANAVMDMSHYSLINVGSTLPPTECGGDR